MVDTRDPAFLRDPNTPLRPPHRLSSRGASISAIALVNLQEFGQHALTGGTTFEATLHENVQTFGAHAFTAPDHMQATRFNNAQSFPASTFSHQLNATLWANSQSFPALHSFTQTSPDAPAGTLRSSDDLALNAGLVFCIGSHPEGSVWLGRDLVNGSDGTLRPGGNLAGVNARQGTWRCLESTSTTDGGISFPNPAALRAITNKRTIAFYGRIDSAANWGKIFCVPYQTGWANPYHSQALYRNGTTAGLQAGFTVAGTGSFPGVASGWSTGEHLIIVTLNGDIPEARFYVDGVLIGGAPTALGSGGNIDWSDLPLVILGRSTTSPAEGTDGLCYWAAVWNRVLSAAEVANLQTAPLHMFEPGTGTTDPDPPPPPPPPPPPDPGGDEPAPPATVGTTTFTPSTATSTAINNVGANMRIRFEAGTYNNLQIVPKTGQWYEGIGGRDAVTFQQISGSGRCFSGSATGVFIQGITIRQYSPGGRPRHFDQVPPEESEDGRSQTGAIEFSGSMATKASWTVFQCRVVEIYGSAIKLSGGMRISQCIIGDNGQSGLNGRSWDAIIEDCDIYNNNRNGFNRGWDASAIKLTGGAGNATVALPAAHNIKIRRCKIHHNNTFGIWTDWDVFGLEIHNNSIYANAWSALSFEASAVMHVHHNQFGDNMRGAPGQWLGSTELNWQSCKRSIFEDNLVIAYANVSSDFCYFSQHVRAPNASSFQGGYRIGHFTGTENIFRRNVFVQRDGARAWFRRDFASSTLCSQPNPDCEGLACGNLCGTDDTSCRLVNPALPPPGLEPDRIGGNSHCFVPNALDPHLNISENNTYRSSLTATSVPRWGDSSGRVGPQWGTETGHTIGGSPDSFIPDWTVLPTWTTPPGKLGVGAPSVLQATRFNNVQTFGSHTIFGNPATTHHMGDLLAASGRTLMPGSSLPSNKSWPTLFLNVDDFGAAGNGTTNDATAINNCLAQAKSQGRGVRFGVGKTYRMDAKISGSAMSGWNNLLWEGNGATILVGPSVDATTGNAFCQPMNCTGIRIYDLTIDGNRQNRGPHPTSDLFGGHNFQPLSCHDVAFVRCGSHRAMCDGWRIGATGAIALSSFPTWTLLLDCEGFDNVRLGIGLIQGFDTYILGGRYNEQKVRAPAGGIDIEPTKAFDATGSSTNRTLIDGVELADNSESGMSFANLGVTPTRNVWFQNNLLARNGGIPPLSGNEFSHAAMTINKGLQNVNILNNTIRDHTRTGPPDANGNSLTRGSGIYIAGNASGDLTISGNIFSGNTAKGSITTAMIGGIAVHDLNSITITGNDINIVDTGNQGVNMPSGTVPATVTVTGNTCTRKTSDGVAFAQNPGGNTEIIVGAGGAGTLEAVASGTTQVTLTAQSGERQIFAGFGWSGGTGPTVQQTMASGLYNAHADALFGEVDCKIVRVWYNGNVSDTLTRHVGSGFISLCLNRGVDTFLLAPEGYQSGDHLGYASSLASQIKQLIDGGLPINVAAVMNEPGSGGRADIPDSQMASFYQAFRNALNSQGLSSMPIIAPEYASADGRPDNFYNVMNAAGATHLVASGAHHSYNMAARPQLYDDRWKTKGKGLWQTEAGGASVPTTGARFLNDLNYGCEYWNFFIGVVSMAGDLSQKLISFEGQKNAWFNAVALISQAVPRGTKPRLITTSANVANFGGNRTVYTFGMKPKVTASVGLRPNGKWYVAIQNNTNGAGRSVGDGFDYPAAETMQFTLTVNDLSGANKTFSGTRVDNTGFGLTSVSYPMVNGQMRMTLSERQLIVLQET